MKTITTILPMLLILNSLSVFAQVPGNEDDIYYTPNDDLINSTDGDTFPPSDDEYKTIYDTNKENAPAYKSTEEYTDQDGDTYVTNNYYYEEEEFDYDDYYDYSYSSRLRRFHNPVYSYGYYDPYYTNSYWYSYDPYDYGASIYLGYPWWGTTISWGWGLGSLIFGWGYPSYYSHYGYQHHHHWNHHYNHHYAGHYGHYGYGYGSYGYGYGGYGYGNSYWAGYNDGYWDGSYDYNGYYGGATGQYYNSYDDNSHYYGPRITTASNSKVTSTGPKGLADIYQAEYGTTITRFHEIETPEKLTSESTKTRFHENESPEKSLTNTTYDLATPTKPVGAKGGDITNDKDAILSRPDKTAVKEPVSIKAANTSTGNYSTVTKPKSTNTVKYNGPKSTNTGYSGVKNSSSKPKASTRPEPGRVYEGPSSTGSSTGVREYGSPKKIELKKYSYEKPKSYSNSGHSKPSTSKPTYQKPKASRPSSYSKSKSSSPSYTKPRTTSKPNYERPKSEAPTNYSKPRSNTQTRPSTRPARPVTNPRKSSGSSARPSSYNRSSTISRSSSQSRVSAPSRPSSRSSSSTRTMR